MFNEVHLEPIRTNAPFTALFNGIELPRMCLAYFRFDSPYVAGTVEPLDFHTIQWTRTGSIVFDTGSEAVHSTVRRGAVLSAGQRIGTRAASGNGILTLVVKERVLRDTLSSWVGRTVRRPIRFKTAFDPSHRRIASYLSLLDSFAREVDRPGSVLEAPAAVASFEQALLTAMLFSFEHSLSAMLHAPPAEAGVEQVREIEAYLEAHASEPIDLEKVATETGHSIWSIYRAFRRHRDYTPMEFLRRIRMRMVRERLLQARRDESVTNAALHCGFSHLGRFAVEYKRRFGESPSRTLERAVRSRGS
jgi:AraC-like DNA-binding protein